jgi:hypothetical protein
MPGPDVFLCYAREDYGTVLRLFHDLRHHGLDVWLDTDRMRPGQLWEQEIVRAIQSARFFIVCISRNSLGRRGTVHRELREAIKVASTVPLGQIFIIPLILDDDAAKKFPEKLKKIHYARIVGRHPIWDRTITQLLEIMGRKPRTGVNVDPGREFFFTVRYRYFEHVLYWTLGRAIGPRPDAPRKSAIKFGDASVKDYMFPIDSLIRCHRKDKSKELMRQLFYRLYPNHEMIAEKVLPVIAVVDDPTNTKGPILEGLITPTDLDSKFPLWYEKNVPVESGMWFPYKHGKDKLKVAYNTDTVRQAYRKMGDILTGIPVVEKGTRILRGFLPHHGTREDWKR